MTSITPFLWFDGNAEAAMDHYVATFPGARVIETSRFGPGAPMAEGTLMSATLDLAGQRFIMLNGGPTEPFSPAVSFLVSCDTQDEIDRIWAPLADGGQEQQCGWVRDRFGITWQVIPRNLPALLGNPDQARAGRAMQAMLGMRKIDIAALEAA